MKVTAVFDLLSHWCLAAWPAFEAAREELGHENVDLQLAPILNGFPMGVPPNDERWFYTRGSRAYAMTLRPDWYETDRTTTLWANAAAICASELGADLAVTALGMMQAAMQAGELLGRRENAVAAAARIAHVERAAIDDLMNSAEVGRRLNDGNASLARWQCFERPSWRIENASGDHVTMQGVWQREAILACIAALKQDESAYAEAGSPAGA